MSIKIPLTRSRVLCSRRALRRVSHTRPLARALPTLLRLASRPHVVPNLSQQLVRASLVFWPDQLLADHSLVLSYKLGANFSRGASNSIFASARGHPLWQAWSNPASRLLHALQRVGLKEDILAAVEGIYTDREFVVRDGGRTSAPKPQRAGISQGCPLSPFLFVIVMTILIKDARSELHSKIGDLADEIEEVLYAFLRIVRDKMKTLRLKT